MKSIDYFEFVASKGEGREIGGIYKGKSDGHLYMIKRMDPVSAVSEYIGSNLARLVVGERAPTVELVSTGDSILAASRFIPNFETLKDYRKKSGLPDECYPYGCVVRDNGEFEAVVPYLDSKVQATQKVENSEEINAIAEWLQHGDLHDRNVGVVHAKSGVQAALIDFSLSLGRQKDFYAYPMIYYQKNFDPLKMHQALEKIIAISPQEIDATITPLLEVVRLAFGNELPKDLNYDMSMSDMCDRATSLEETKWNIISSLIRKQEVLKIDSKILKFIVDNMIGAEEKDITITPELEELFAKAESPILSKLYDLSSGSTEAQLLQYFTRQPKLAAKILTEMIEDDNKFNKLLRIIKKLPPISRENEHEMLKLFRTSISGDKPSKEQFEKWKQIEQVNIATALSKAMALNRVDRIEALLPYTHLSYLAFMLHKAAEGNNVEAIDALLPFVPKKYLEVISNEIINHKIIVSPLCFGKIVAAIDPKVGEISYDTRHYLKPSSISNPDLNLQLISSMQGFLSSATNVTTPANFSAITIPKVDVVSQIELVRVLYQMGANVYNSLTDYFKTELPPISVSSSGTIGKMNDKVYKRINKLNKIIDFSEELKKIKKKLPSDSDQREKIQEHIDHIEQFKETVQKLNDKYHRLQYPVIEDDLNEIYEEARTLHSFLRKKVKGMVDEMCAALPHLTAGSETRYEASTISAPQLIQVRKQLIDSSNSTGKQD